MKTVIVVRMLVMTGCLLLVGSALAHPPSGIVVDRQGNLFVLCYRQGLVEIAANGKRSDNPNLGGHWLSVDEDGSFSRADPRYFHRVTPDGVKPALIVGDGSPTAVTGGNLYYASSGQSEGEMTPGGLALARMSPDGKQTLFSPALKKTLQEFDDGVTGLAVGPDGSLYVAGWTFVLKVKMDGAVTVLAHPVVVRDCDPDPADHKPSNRLPLLRGLAVDPSGNVYAAATSCHRLLKIRPGGQVESLLKSERPWSPTGVAFHDGNLYVLEFTNANGPATEGWTARVRKLASDGRINTILSAQNR